MLATSSSDSSFTDRFSPLSVDTDDDHSSCAGSTRQTPDDDLDLDLDDIHLGIFDNVEPEADDALKAFEALAQLPETTSVSRIFREGIEIQKGDSSTARNRRLPGTVKAASPKLTCHEARGGKWMRIYPSAKAALLAFSEAHDILQFHGEYVADSQGRHVPIKVLCKDSYGVEKPCRFCPNETTIVILREGGEIVPSKVGYHPDPIFKECKNTSDLEYGNVRYRDEAGGQAREPYICFRRKSLPALQMYVPRSALDRFVRLKFIKPVDGADIGIVNGSGSVKAETTANDLSFNRIAQSCPVKCKRRAICNTSEHAG